ncbi:MAG TPA: carbamoyltransferase [Pyrinomonadaceae bacterium]|jgi:carbamoyltransferase|nr:carbamoyltransferase [Pyrinomonadaceae bacterium]
MSDPIILGISAFYHDSAAAIVRGGEIIAAAQEERFSRKKHDPRFPRHAINYCLGEAFIEADELDAVVFYDHPLLTLDRVLKSILSATPRTEDQWIKASRSILGTKLFVEKYIKDMLKADVKVYFTEHHASHAASAFYPSPFEEAAILTFDGVGEWATTTLGTGSREMMKLLKEIDYPHSLGLLYSAFTYFTGFKVNSGEYKLMGLAPYGKPVYADAIREQLIDIKDDGSFRLNMEYFGYLDSDRMTNEKFARVFDGEARAPESAITRREMNLAASVQAVTEEIVLKTARHLRELTGKKNIVMAGGVALNCVANGLLQREKIFDRVWIQPAAGDAGGALGGALLMAYQKFGVKRAMNPTGRDTQRGSYLGPKFSSNEVRAFLDRKSFPYHQITGEAERAKQIAVALSEGKVVGYLNGRMEFGPRALGGRSILGDPRRAETQATMNLKIKYRESFRPFAPSVLVEKASEYFELDTESPYMLLVAPVKKERQIPMDTAMFDTDAAGDVDLLAIVNKPRSDIPAVTHVNYSARVQTVHPDDNPAFYAVIKEFEKLTGCAVVVNTSFNVRGEPIVCTPQDAYRCFMWTEMDLLVLEDCLLWKTEQPVAEKDDSWKQEYELD